MRNYVIINEINSNTIQGLAINILPPITKPMMRSQIEEIDGRDGDLVTELGYSAYDKSMEIGLYGNFDIDEIIKYFTGEGTIVFSNEEDKYYNFKILDQIDYEKLLKFKTAVVTFHCQPFKYPVEETPIEGEAITITGSGANITLENTIVAPMKIKLKGNTSQRTTTGKNLLSVSLASLKSENTTGTWSGDSYTHNNVVWTPVFDNGELSYINANGQANGNSDFNVGSYRATATGEFRGNGCPASGSTSKYRIFFSYLGSDVGSGVVGTLSTNNNVIATARVYDSFNASNLKFYPMLRIASISDATYEPYTNGASPNPSYPQDIHVVSGDNSIEVCGKNLAPTDWASKFVSAVNVQNLVYITEKDNRNCLRYNPGAGYGDYPHKNFTLGMTFKENTQYTLSYDILKTDATSKTICIRYTDGTWSTPSDVQTLDTWVHQTITSSANKTIDYICPYYTAGISYIDIDTWQIEEETTATTYEPYKGASYPISLGGINLFNPSVADTNCTVSNGLITIATTSTDFYIKGASAYSEANKFLTLPSGSYYIKSTNSNIRISMYGDNGSLDTASNQPVTLSSTTNFGGIRVRSVNSTSLRNLSFGIIISTENRDFIPYTIPIELCKIGTYQDKIDKSTGKNLINLTNANLNASWDGGDANKITLLDNYRVQSTANYSSWRAKSIDIPNIKPNTTYTLTISLISSTSTDSNKGAIRLPYYNGTTTGNVVFSGEYNYYTFSSTTTKTFTFTTPNDLTNMGLSLSSYGASTNAIFGNIILNEGTTALPYEPYGTGWYLKKEIGKVVFDGTQTWQKRTDVPNLTNTSCFRSDYSTNVGKDMTSNTPQISNLFECLNNTNDIEHLRYTNIQYYRFQLFINKSRLSSDDETGLNNFLSSNNMIVYYVLATPTYETITDTTLLSQLEAFKPYSYNPVTNITQTNNDAPFELDVSLSYTNTMNVNNVGNIYAKPILTIEGSGTIGIILNDIEVLSVDLGTDEKITIDVPNLQAYNPDNDVLLNRNVTGDYMKLLINDGDNTIAFSGSVTSATLTNYTRWI